MGLILEWKSFSSKLEKVIRTLFSPPGRPVITGSHTELFRFHVRLWEQGKLTFAGKNTFESVGDFIFRTYDVRYEDNPEKSMLRKSIISETYAFLNED